MPPINPTRGFLGVSRVLLREVQAKEFPNHVGLAQVRILSGHREQRVSSKQAAREFGLRFTLRQIGEGRGRSRSARESDGALSCGITTQSTR